MAKKYRVTLTDEERHELLDLIRTGKAAARRLAHARVLLQADQGPTGPGLTDEAIAAAVEVSRPTIERIRKLFVEEGLEAALNRRLPRRPRLRKLDGEQEARLIALACSPPPDGQGHWALRLLADKLVELEVTDAISHETVRQVLKKTSSSRGWGSSGSSRRRRAGSSSGAWRTCWTSTPAPPTPGARWSAWTSCRCS